ncbi:hypothetical protein PUN28_020939 [Cardiocondyla obscurior]|uniref:Reverse transcriptase domain-containing protein n=1 Tax=Cardiocondyla obscurior TaxID=286306 RepID=A0AAW2E8R8_9HYME
MQGEGEGEGSEIGMSAKFIIIQYFNSRFGKSDEEVEGVKIKREKVYSLSYADDVVLMAEKEEDMRSLMARLEECLKKKRLELNSY